LWSFLKEHSKAGDVKWNFWTKFVVQCRKDWCDIQRHNGHDITYKKALSDSEL